MMLFINSTISIKASIISVAMIIFLFLYSVRVFGIFKLFTEEVTRTSGRLAKATVIKIVLNLILVWWSCKLTYLPFKY